MSNQPTNRRADDLLADLLGAERVIVLRPSLVDLVDCMNAALMTQQGLYWSKRATRDDGFFYKTEADWYTETRLTTGKQRRARARLREFPFWHEKRCGVPAQLFFKVDAKCLYEALLQLNQNRPTSPLNALSPAQPKRENLTFQNSATGQREIDHHFSPESTQESNPPVVPPLARGDKTTSHLSGKSSYFEWRGEWIEVLLGRRSRLFTERERESLTGTRAQDVLVRIQAKGFQARIVPQAEVDSWQQKSASSAA